MKIRRTPDERFAGLQDFPFEPHYAEVQDGDGGSLRTHYLDEGDPSADPILLMHGNPAWCYLYRKMIPALVAAGHRVIAAYNAPFPDESYKAGARVFASLVPHDREHPAFVANRSAWKNLEKFQKPFRTAFSDSDPMTKGADAPMRKKIPGAADQLHTTIKGAGHFLQEERPEELTRVVIDFIKQNPIPG